MDIDPELVAERFDEPDVRVVLATTDVLITGWGCSPVDATVLAAAPRLRAVLHAAGSVKAEARALGARPAGLDELLSRCDVVSVHAPATPQTRGLLGRAQLGLMRDGAVLINTARGELVDTGALIDEVRSGRLTAVLDVTDPEPLPAGSPLFDIPGVFLTPHVAGSHGNEIERLGRNTIAELRRLVAGEPLANQVQRARLSRSA